MDPRHRNCERKRQKRLISAERCQIDLFLPSSSMNMPYMSIKINYPLARISIHTQSIFTSNSPGAGATSSSSSLQPKTQRAAFFSLTFKAHECVTQTQTRIHTLHTQSPPQQVLYSPRSQRGNYHARKSVPSPIIISLLHYPQNQRGCFPPIITDDTFRTAATFPFVHIPQAYGLGRFYGFS